MLVEEFKDGPYRQPYDADRPKGSKAMPLDHTKPVAAIERYVEAAAHLDLEEKVEWANSPVNLRPLDAAANSSKADLSITDWHDNTRPCNGKMPAERFGRDREADIAKEKEAEASFQRLKEQGKQRSLETGRRSRRAEFCRIGGQALRSVFLSLCADFFWDVFKKFCAWLNPARRSIQTLMDHLEDAIRSFAAEWREHLVNASSSLDATVCSAIFGPVVRLFQNVFAMLKQGWYAFKEAVQYLKDPASKGKSLGVKVCEIGKIIVAGCSAAGSILLSEVTEKALLQIPGLGVEIPLLGSPASLIGILVGGLVGSLVGSLVLWLIDSIIAWKKKQEHTAKVVRAQSDVLQMQNKLIAVVCCKCKVEGEALSQRIQENRDVLDARLSTLERRIFGSEGPEAVQAM